jgi:hypothetical protein
MSPNTMLPEGFEHLAPFLDWALETEPERAGRRVASRFEEVRAFYDAVLPSLPAALNHLKAYRIEDLPPSSRTLMRLLLSYAEAALAVENFGQVTVPQGFELAKFETRMLGGSF